MLEKVFMSFRPRLKLPTRSSLSLEDSIKNQKRQYAGTQVAKIKLAMVWSDEVQKRPFDVPMYTAFRGAASIVLYISARSIPISDDLGRVFSEKRPWTWRTMAFPEGPFPLLRCSLVVPDNPSDPLLLESPLDITQGDVQAFCEAAVAAEQIDVFVGHENIGEGEIWAASFRCGGIAKALFSEVNRVADSLRPNATKDEFHQSIRLMESKFPSGAHGMERAKSVRLEFAGPARNLSIED